MLELTPQQIAILEKLFRAGFRPIAIPPYENALCVYRGECAAALTPVQKGGIRLLAPAAYLIGGKLSVRMKRGERDVFVWKEKEIEATPERLRELEGFRRELTSILAEEAAPKA